MNKLLVSEQKQLRTITYESPYGIWTGHSTGQIYGGSYILVYPAKGKGSKGYTYRKCFPVRIPLTRVYSF